MAREPRPTRTQTAVLTNNQTGEISDIEIEFEVPNAPRPDGREKEHHVRQFDMGMLELLRIGISGGDRLVLWAMTLSMEFGGPFSYVNKDIAALLDVKPQQVSNAVRRLKDAGVLIDMGRRGHVLIHPRFYWKGSNKDRAEWLLRLDGITSRKDSTE